MNLLAPVARSGLVGLLLFASLLGRARAADRQRWTMLVDIAGQRIEGMPLAWSSDRIFLLARDGRLWDFSPKKADNYRKTSSSFTSYSAAEMRGALERELAGKLVVSGTGHYLVAHPKEKSEWAQRFEELYRSCFHYFALHDMKVHEPEFPLIAVVWGKRDDFVHYAVQQGSPVGTNILGFYSPTTNRVTLYDQGAGTKNPEVWQQNESTIIHEATHQMAFNTGVHNRFAPTPKWLAEGLGTLFEARGVWDWRRYPRLSDRVNQPRLEGFRRWQQSGRSTGAFVNLLTSDRQFQANPSAAYCEAWAWVLFFTETYPRKFSQYVQRVAARPDFQDYPTAQRMSDFTNVFGQDLRLLEVHFLKFMASLQ
jgi:hypothetical protein